MVKKLKQKKLAYITLAAILAAGVIWFLLLAQKKPITAQTVNTPASTPKPAPEATPNTEYKLRIEKLNLWAPIVANVPGTDENAYYKALKGGVAHYRGTPLPGHKTEQGENGNSFIFGHSSYFKPQPYDKVFEKLNEVQVGDTFQVIHNEETLQYKVFRSAIVKDDDLSVLEPDKQKREIVTLMTCWPPGTIAKRYIVQAERVVTTASPTPAASPAVLPATH